MIFLSAAFAIQLFSLSCRHIQLKNKIMRKRSAFFAPLALAGVLFLSCSIESGVAEPEPDPQTDPAFYLVTVDEARAGVESLLADLDPPTRGSARTISETIVSGGFGATRSGDGPEEPLYYIFNFTNDEGFAVTSGDSALRRSSASPTRAASTPRRSRRFPVRP